MSRSAAVLLALAILAVAALTACGSDDSGGSSTSDKAAATAAETTAAPAPAPAPAATTPDTTATTTSDASPAENAKVVAACHKRYDPLVVRLRRVEASLDGTPTFSAYSATVRKLVSDFDKLKAGKDPSDSCLQNVGLPLGGAYLQNATATQKWSECRKADNCKGPNMDYIKGRWAMNPILLKRVKEGFDQVVAN